MKRVVPILVSQLLRYSLLSLPLEAKLILVTISPTIATMKLYGLLQAFIPTIKY
jgi:anti-anti-sigma regulatory factor